MKLLIVDDEKDYIDFLKGRTKEYCSDIFTAINISEALNILKKNVIDFAFIDIKLEDIDGNKDGLEILKWIKKENLNTKVIIISFYKEFDWAVDSLNKGAIYFLTKPFKEIEVSEVIEKYIKK